MLPKNPEFLDAICKAGPLDKGWYLINVKDYGYFVWRESFPETVHKIDNIELWLEEKGINNMDNDETVTCAVRNIINKRAKIQPPDKQKVELWLNIIIPDSVKDSIRVESYTDQNHALVDAEEELKSNFEIHTKRVVVEIP